MKYQKKALNVFVNWKYWLIQFKEKIKTVILRYFQKNVNTFSKRKYITDDIKLSSDDSDGENSNEEKSNEKNINISKFPSGI